MDKHCRICHNISCSNHGKSVSFLGDGWKCNYIPVPTNADRIRSMSDEDLANLLTDYSNNSGWVTEIGRKICFERIYEWLQQPSKGE